MMKRYLLVLLLFFPIAAASADVLATIEKAISIADRRISQGIFLTEIKNDREFESQACRQMEFALINLNSKEPLTDDWYNLSIYCLSRKHKRYNLALSILKKAYDAEEYPKFKKWIKKRIDLLETKSFIEDNFDINKEISDLRRVVFH